MIQSTFRAWPLLFSIFLAIVGYYLYKKIHLLRRSKKRSIFLLLHKSENADEPGRVQSIETNSSRKKQHLENMAGGLRTPISSFPSRFTPISQHWTDRWHASKSTSLDFNSYGTQFPCSWIILIPLRRFEMACWVTHNDSTNSSCVWHESSTNNASNAKYSKIFSFPSPCRS